MNSFVTPKQQIMIALIEQQVAAIYLLDPDEYAVLLRGPLRTAQVAEARQMMWYILHSKLGFSSVICGNIYGRDHSTVLQGVVKFKSRESFAELRNEATRILDDRDIREIRSMVTAQK